MAPKAAKSCCDGAHVHLRCSFRNQENGVCKKENTLLSMICINQDCIELFLPETCQCGFGVMNNDNNTPSHVVNEMGNNKSTWGAALQYTSC